METMIKEEMSYLVRKAQLKDEAKMSNGAVKKNVIFVSLLGSDNRKYTTMVSAKQELQRQKKQLDIPDFLKLRGKVVVLSTEHQIANETGFRTKDKDGNDVEVLHTKTGLQPTPFGEEATEEEVEVFKQDLKDSKADEREVRNIGAVIEARDKAVRKLSSESLDFYKNNPMFASAIVR